jgi:diguanylate cyclase (GGDEF)-like protein
MGNHDMQEQFERRRLKALRSYEILDTEVEQAFDDIVKIAAQACNAPIAVINFIDESRQWFKAELGLGIRETPLDISICRHALLEQDMMIIRDTRTDQRTCINPLVAADNGLRFYAGALITSHDGFPLGTLCVLDRQPRDIRPEQLEVLSALRRQIMLLLDYRRTNRAQLRLLNELDEERDAMAQLAYRDPLTGLLNRRAFENRLDYQLSLSNTQHEPATILMMDIDYFKRINDTFGHLQGDRVLVQAAELFRHALRSKDVICRWGGEEFIALLTHTTLSHAGDIAQRIHDMLAASTLQNELGDLTLSVSMGITGLRKTDTMESVIQRADGALYDAKRAGRQRTHIV